MEDLAIKTLDGIHRQKNEKEVLSFECQIQKIQLRRWDAIYSIQRSKKQQKENLQAYLGKKLIVPSVIKQSCSVHAFMKPEIFNNIFKNNNAQEQKLQTKYQQFQNPPAKQKNGKISKHCRFDLNLVEKWKLQMTPQETNCLLFGKQLRIGTKNRQKYLSNQAMSRLKSCRILHKKGKAKSDHLKFFLISGKMNKKENFRNSRQISLKTSGFTQGRAKGNAYSLRMLKRATEPFQEDRLMKHKVGVNQLTEIY